MANYHPLTDYIARQLMFARLNPHICTAEAPYDYETHGEYSCHPDTIDGQCPHCGMPEALTDGAQ